MTINNNKVFKILLSNILCSMVFYANAQIEKTEAVNEVVSSAPKSNKKSTHLLPKSPASKSSENKINTVSKVLIPGMSLALLSVILCRICGNRSDGTPEDLGKPIQNNLAEPNDHLAEPKLAKPIIPAVKPVAASKPVLDLETFKKNKSTYSRLFGKRQKNN